MDYELLETFIESVKQEQVYLEFIKQKKSLEENQEVIQLIHTIERKQEEYQDLKKYDSYINLDEMSHEINKLKKQLYMHPIVINYQQALRDLNHYLDELTKIIFKDIADDLHVGRWENLYARH